MKVFTGDGCLGTPVASGPTNHLFGLSVSLPVGDYSAAETQQPGWELRSPAGFCQDFSVQDSGFFDEPIYVDFTNRRIRDGDINKDGVTNSIDVVLVLQFIAGLISEQPNTVKADVNEDGMVNAVDTALMLQFEAGLIDSLPQVPDDN